MTKEINMKDLPRLEGKEVPVMSKEKQAKIVREADDECVQSNNDAVLNSQSYEWEINNEELRSDEQMKIDGKISIGNSFMNALGMPQIDQTVDQEWSDALIATVDRLESHSLDALNVDKFEQLWIEECMTRGLES